MRLVILCRDTPHVNTVSLYISVLSELSRLTEDKCKTYVHFILVMQFRYITP